MIAFKLVSNNTMDLLHFHAIYYACAHATYAGCERVSEVSYAGIEDPDHGETRFEQLLLTSNSHEMAAI